jgi:hypothetical protein
MITRAIISICGGLLFLGACKHETKKYENADVPFVRIECGAYPEIVERLRMKELYDSAKWTVLTYQCDWPYRPKTNKAIDKTFGQLRLSFDTLFIKRDTVEFIFQFKDGDALVSSGSIRDYASLITGAAFSTKDNGKLYLSSPDGLNWHTENPQSRYNNPLDKDVLGYIKNNYPQLDKCFKEAVDKRKIRGQ